MKASRFDPALSFEWNKFVDCCENSHFFFNRNYMDYHRERFHDYSLIVNEGQGLKGVFPANAADGIVYSHQGLSFGGLITKSARSTEIGHMIEEVCAFLAKHDIRKLVYKPLPLFYHAHPSQSDCYMLHQLGGKITRRELGAIIDLRASLRYSAGKRDNLRRARKCDLVVTESADPGLVMTLVSTILQTRHGARATHTNDEMTLLASRFPQNIRIFEVRRQGQAGILSGAIVFSTGRTAHTQYLANSEDGLTCGALDFLVDHLLQNVYKNFTWFSFGISTENGGKKLNHGLQAYKEGFGATGVVVDTYELEL